MKFYHYILPIAVSLSLISCEKEVDLNLRSVEPQLVIDASIGAMHPCMVRLSLTQDYSNQNKPRPVSGALITIKDQDGNRETLRELGSDGVYASRVLGVSGTTYTLTIEADGEVYEATDILPHTVPLDSIRTYKLDSGGDVYYFPCVTFTDPLGVDNYYYYILSINNRAMQATRFEDDNNLDGKLREPILFFDDKENEDKELEVGDLVRVEMQSIGKGAYTFFNTISSPGGMPNSNPRGNFSGNVLGMFKTYGSSYVEMTITEEDLAK